MRDKNECAPRRGLVSAGALERPSADVGALAVQNAHNLIVFLSFIMSYYDDDRLSIGVFDFVSISHQREKIINRLGSFL